MPDEFDMGAGDNSKARLNSYIDRVKRLSEEKAAKMKEYNADIKAVCDEAKSAGYDTKTIRQIAKMASREQDALEEEHAMLEMYGKAYGLTIFA